jgi:hypothetical protein
MSLADAPVHRTSVVAGICLGVVFTGIGILMFAAMMQLPAIVAVPLGVLFGAAVGLMVWRGSLAIADGAGAALGAFLQPSGGSTPYRATHSAEEALAARGDIAGALAAYEALVKREPANVVARKQAAELYARHDSALRAAELLAEMRRIPGVDRGDELYASQRLIDLYLGPLGDRGRAMVELRRLADRFPGTPEADGALRAMRRLKEEGRGG